MEHGSFEIYRKARRLSSDRVLEIAQNIENTVGTYELACWKIFIFIFFSSLISLMLALTLPKQVWWIIPLYLIIAKIIFAATKSTRHTALNTLKILKTEGDFPEAMRFFEAMNHDTVFMPFTKCWRNIQTGIPNTTSA